MYPISTWPQTYFLQGLAQQHCVNKIKKNYIKSSVVFTTVRDHRPATSCLRQIRIKFDYISLPSKNVFSKSICFDSMRLLSIGAITVSCKILSILLYLFYYFACLRVNEVRKNISKYNPFVLVFYR